MVATTYPRTGRLTQNTLLLYDPRTCSDKSGGCAGRRGIIVNHGHAGTALQAIQSGSFGTETYALAAAGFVVIAADFGNDWGDDAAMTIWDNLYAELVTYLGCVSVVGLLGWSMGGARSLRAILHAPTHVACTWVHSPASDLRWVAGAGGYTPAYSPGSVTADPTWATEMTADYPSGYTSADPLQNVSGFRSLHPVKIAHATDDAAIPYAASTYFVGQVADAKVTMRSPDVTGGHGGSITNVPATEVVKFFNEQWAA